tara:strand:- start:10737 stop:11672 length:936 start_codon:yes stop_codon:yes gene_type:complete
MLTVLIATYNGSATLERSLENFTQVSNPKGGYKLVVVDNASTDNTPDILRSYETRLPLAWLRIERQGKNVALNAGLVHAEGDLIVFTDDDTLVQKDWLVKLRGIADQHPEVAMWGGVIKPVWPRPPEPWILDHVPLGAVYALTDTAQVTGAISPDMLWGPNMAVRAQVFHEGHRFNEDIGPAAGQYTMGSEVEFTCRMAEAGFSSWFFRDAVVRHMIRPNQLDREWVIKRAYRFGKLKYFRKRSEPIYQSKLYKGVPRWMYLSLVKDYFKSWVHTLTGNQASKFIADWDLQYHLGYISAAWDSSDKSPADR